MDRQLGEEHSLYESFLHRIAQGEFAVIGYSSTQISLKTDSVFFADCRSCMPKETYLVAGGFSPTFRPDIWLKAGVHAVILGYGEYPFSQFCQFIAENSLEKNIGQIAGIAYSSSLFTPPENGTQCIIQYAKSIDRDTFKIFAYDNQKAMHIDYTKYWKHNKGKEFIAYGSHTFKEKSISLYTTSTCPNRCGYCGSNRFLTSASGKKHHLQMLNIDELFDLVLSEIDKYQPDRISFFDDDFLCSPQRGLQFANLIVEAKQKGRINKDICFCCQARLVDFLIGDKKPNLILIQALVDANFNHISLEVESFHEKILHDKVMNKFGYTKNNIHDVLNACIDIGLNVQVNIMLFAPNATIEELMFDVEQSLHIAEKGLAIVITGPIWAFFGTTCYEDDSIVSSMHSIHLPFSDEMITIKDTLISNYPEVQNIADMFDEKIKEKLMFYSFHSERECSRQLCGVIKLETIAELCGYYHISKRAGNFISSFLAMQNK